MTFKEQQPVPSSRMKVFMEIVRVESDGNWVAVKYLKDGYGRKWVSRSKVDPPELLLGEEVFDWEIVKDEDSKDRRE